MQGARQSDVFFGERESGQDVRQSNATAVQAVANIVRSSLGPVGLDKVCDDYSRVSEGKSQRPLWHHRIVFFLSLSLLLRFVVGMYDAKRDGDDMKKKKKKKNIRKRSSSRRYEKLLHVQLHYTSLP